MIWYTNSFHLFKLSILLAAASHNFHEDSLVRGIVRCCTKLGGTPHGGRVVCPPVERGCARVPPGSFLREYPNIPLFIVPSSTAPPSHGLIVQLPILSLSTVRSKCLSAPLSSARVPHSRIVRCPVVFCPVVPLSIVPVSIVPLSDCPLSPLSHCCIALRRRGLQVGQQDTGQWDSEQCDHGEIGHLTMGQ